MRARTQVNTRTCTRTFLDTGNTPPHTSDAPNQGLGLSLGNGMGEGKEEETFPVYFTQLCSA